MSQIDRTNAEIERIDSRDRTDHSFARLYKALARQLAETVDAREARISELEAELARVKAESLRVVEVASMYNIFGGYSSGYFRWNGMIWRKNRQDKTHAAEINQNEVREFLDSAQVEWIRLEPWRADA